MVDNRSNGGMWGGDRWVAVVVVGFAGFVGLVGVAGLTGCKAKPVPGRYMCDPGKPGTCPADWYCRPTDSHDMTYRCFPHQAAICGDGVRQDGEDCDSADLGSATCESLGFAGGMLLCTADCHFNEKGCLAELCGNETIEGSESCDGTDFGVVSCQGSGFAGGTVSCFRNCSVDYEDCDAPPSCGNGTLDPGEQCDGNVGSKTCMDLGFRGGFLSCNANCSLDTSGCLLAVCGDGMADADWRSYESCDGTDLRNQTCYDLGYPGGELACASDCSFDRSGCSRLDSCGNGVAEGLELCDGDDLGGVTCQDLGYSGGELRCTDACGYDLSGCDASGPICGNGRLEEGEECDGVQFLFQSCRDMGFAGGELGCSPCCCLLDTSRCDCPQGTVRTDNGCVEYNPVHCGNGMKDEGEDCDGTDLGGASCASIGHMAGTLACGTDCRFDTTLCSGGSDCGNGRIDSGEDCDGTNLQGKTCQDFGYQGGILGCTNTCHIDTGGCNTMCGNNVIEVGEDCDGTDLGGQTCTGLNQRGGALACDDHCQFDLSGCLLTYFGLVAAGSVSCVVRYDGVAWCGGQNDFGQLGIGIVDSHDASAVAQPPNLVKDVWVGPRDSCALADTGALWCWGSNDASQLGDWPMTHAELCYGTDCSSLPVAPSADASPIDMAVGDGFACAAYSTYALCWGKNDRGQVGCGVLGTQSPIPMPTQVSNLQSAERLCAGVNFACALDDMGAVNCWGDILVGQLGVGTNDASSTSAVAVVGLTNVTDISCGFDFACAVQDGLLYCWGENLSGQLGTGNTQGSTQPVQVQNLQNVMDVSCGGGFTCAVTQDRRVLCWGDNSEGQLGDGSGQSQLLPVEVQMATGAIELATGDQHACVLTMDARLLCWGLNDQDQFMSSSVVSSSTPVLVALP